MRIGIVQAALLCGDGKKTDINKESKSLWTCFLLFLYDNADAVGDGGYFRVVLFKNFLCYD